MPNDSDPAYAGRVRRVGRTVFCGVSTPRTEEPKKASRKKGEFSCIICDSRFTRVEGVNYHFPGCVQRYGNPQGNCWNDHPSCAFKKTGEQDVAAAAIPRSPSPEKKRLKITLRMPKSSEVSQVGPVSTASRATRSRPALTTSETQPKASIRETKSLSISTDNPPKRLPTRASTNQAKPAEKQRASNPNDNRTQETRSKEAAGVARQTNVGKYHLAASHPPLFKLPAIFHDMVTNAWNKTPMKEAMDWLSTRQINIATMCSGTESPLLALGIIQEGKH